MKQCEGFTEEEMITVKKFSELVHKNAEEREKKNGCDRACDDDVLIAFYELIGIY